MDLCERYNHMMGARVSQRWWEQAILYLDGSKKRAAAAAANLEGEELIGEEEEMPLEWPREWI